MKEEAWVQTYTGQIFRPFDVQLEMISIEDIAHSLSNTCRFNGHSKFFYSVAEHCVEASFIVPRKAALGALLHDAAEAYVGDFVGPLKKYFPAFQELEFNILQKIHERYSVILTKEDITAIHQADMCLLETERRQVMNDCTKDWYWKNDIPPNPLDTKLEQNSARYAEKRFLQRFAELYNGGENI